MINAVRVILLITALGLVSLAGFYFYKVKDMHFDIPKLKRGLEEVLKIQKYDSANGIPNFAAICLNQIPGDPDSTKGNNARGVFWTTPDHTGKETVRDKPIDECAYTEFVKDFEHTYFKEVYEKLSSTFKLGRVRILLKAVSYTHLTLPTKA